MSDILWNLTVQLFFTVGLIALFGLAIWLLNKAFYRLVGVHGKKLCIATGFLGTPVHELGHAFFCIVFGHRITEIKLYQPDSTDGVLGYVRHVYNRRNIYHQVGNFFIGLGPVLLGCGVLLLLILLFVPDLFGALGGIMNNFTFSSAEGFFEIIWEVTKAFFSSESLTDPWWWIFMIPACSVALHMSLSVADMKASKIGLVSIVIFMLALNIILYLVDKGAMLALTDGSLRVSAFILNFLMISILLSLILVGVGGVIRGVTRLSVLRRKGNKSA